NIADTVIEAINKVGSAFYGPIVATFIMAILSNRVSTLGVNIGLLTGVAINLLIWTMGIPIFWIWWNFIGAIVTFVVAYLISLIQGDSAQVKARLELPQLEFATRENAMLVGFFLLIIVFSMSLPSLF
ncbi:MAG: sodium transporter, partial [Bacteroidota bacterium]